MNLSIIIPAYNPPTTFSSLIKSINKITPNAIIIIDDGSTPKINIEHSSVVVLRNTQNKGKGYSLIKGFKYAEKEGYTHAITIDADSQHDPESIISFLEFDKNISLVLGTRNFTTDMPIHRRISNTLTSYIISFLCGQTVIDSQCGYRRYILKDVCSESFKEKGFQFESEVLIKLLRNNCTHENLEIPTIYSNENSSINNINDTFKFIRLILRNIFKD
ncbi:MAG: glycosyltransferase family 2 protein [Candidatus Marinimicrobia bacterium]|nr:glycosyltransferase family 2 protein [Candidatus Neomarinimicrobiota bacterium]